MLYHAKIGGITLPWASGPAIHSIIPVPGII